MPVHKVEGQRTCGTSRDVATIRYDMLDTPHLGACQGRALTGTRLVAAILEGPTFDSSTLAGGLERD